jgi:hypothetical protein
VLLQWAVPADNGSPIDAYKVEILGEDGNYYEDSTYCGGVNLADVVLVAECTVPMSYLAEGPYSLIQGTQIKFRVTAQNGIGWQTAPSDDSAIVGTVLA